MVNDLRIAVRGLLRSPGYAAAAVVTLALGIGATTAMFSVLNRVVLDPLPFRDAERLVLIWGSKPHEGLPEIPFSQPDFQDFREAARSFAPLAAWAPGRGNLTGGEPEQVQYAVVTASLFEALHVQPVLGRSFTPPEDRPGTSPVTIVSQTLWQRRFGGAPAAVGRTLVLDDRAYEIVGVLPPDFSFVTFPDQTQVWLPLGADPSPGRRFARGARSMGVLGRLRDGVSLHDARAEADRIAAGLADAHPRFNTGRQFLVTPLHEQVVRGVRTGALVLLGGVGCVLLIACANVAGLVLARGMGRQRDVAIRAALGASRPRLIRLQLAESLALAATGGAGGLVVAAWIIDGLRALPFRTDSLFVPYSVPRTAIEIDLAALGFTLAVSGVTVLLFGLVPATTLSRTDGAGVLRAGAGTTAGGRQHRTRAILVVAELALALILLVTAGTIVGRFLDLNRTDPGFRREGLLTLQTTLSRTAYREPARIAGFYSAALERLAALPGVTAAAAVEFLPLTGLDGSTGFYIEGRPAPERADEQQVHFRSVSPRYFEVMGIDVTDGRPFTEADRAGALPVAIVNQTMARRYWPGAAALGRRLALDLEAMQFFPDRPPVLDIASAMREIVGTVPDVQHAALGAAPVAEMYVPYLQRPVHDMTFVLSSRADPEALAGPARAAVRSIDSNQPIARVESMASIVAASIAQPRANSLLLAAFAAAALALAVLGVYALLAYLVAQRTTELGIRLALGAAPGQLCGLVFGQSLRLIAAGLAVGCAGAVLVTRAISALLPDFQPAGGGLILTAGAALALAALAASYLPARRATRVDPLAALRSE